MSCSSFFTLEQFFRQAAVSGGLLLSLPNESKCLTQDLHRTCQVLAMTCQDLRLHLRRANSKG